jgi:hypothetical protein
VVPVKATATRAIKQHAKIVRAGPLSTQWYVGAVAVMGGTWRQSYLDRMEAFAEEVNIDDADASAMAFNVIEPVPITVQTAKLRKAMDPRKEQGPFPKGGRPMREHIEGFGPAGSDRYNPNL